MKRIISCAGYGCSGSSAITDFVSEFSGVKSLGGGLEFTLLSSPGGVFDLEHSLIHGIGVDYAIHRFIHIYNQFVSHLSYSAYESEKILDSYLTELGIISWFGGTTDSLHTPRSRENLLLEEMARISFNKVMKNASYYAYEPSYYDNGGDIWRPFFYPAEKQYYAHVAKQKFYSATKIFLQRLFSCFFNDTEILMVDQFLPSHSSASFLNYYDDIKLIYVDRNPVDLFLLNYFARGERWIPSLDVDIFISWYTETRKHRLFDEVDASKMLFINFESMVYDYDVTTSKIKSFLEFDDTRHIKKYSFFDPCKSIINCNLKKRFSLSDDIAEDVAKIEIELSEYCFDFCKYEKRNQNDGDLIKVDLPIGEIQKRCNNILVKKEIDKKLIPCTAYNIFYNQLSNYITPEMGVAMRVYKMLLFPFFITKQFLLMMYNSFVMLKLSQNNKK